MTDAAAWGDRLACLEQRLGMQFRDRSLLELALRHRSAARDRTSLSNERLEFLGDSIVGMVVSDYLYGRYGDDPEGGLAKRKAYLVSEAVLAAAAQALGLHDAVELGAQECLSGVRDRPSTMSDVFEAVVAAVYLDRGVRAARKLVRSALREPMADVCTGEFGWDCKSALQEWTQAKYRTTPRYQVESESGADHDKTFAVVVYVNSQIAGRGSGRSKKHAEQQAARIALGSVAEGSS